jgi:hypothetical protein
MFKQLLALSLLFATQEPVKQDVLTKVDELTIIKCEGDCKTFTFDNPNHKGVSLTTNKGKLWIEHGAPYKDIKVPQDHKLWSCYCHQKECVQYTPKDLQYHTLEWNKLTLFVPSNLKPAISLQELEKIDKERKEAYENL